MKFGEKLTLLRKQSHLSMNALAPMLGTTPPTLKRIEQGTSQPDSTLLSHLQALTGLPVDRWLNERYPLPEEITVTAPTSIRTVTPSKDYEKEQAAWRNFLTRLVSEVAEGNQQSFARKVGLENAFLSKMLNGTQKITKSTMYRVGQYTGRYDWLPEEQRPGVTGDSGPVHEGQALKRYLDEKNIKQTELARLLNKNKATITLYIQSEKLQDRTWNALSAALGASYEEIVGAPALSVTATEIRIVGPSVKPYYAPIDAPDQYTSILLIPVRFRAGFYFSIYSDIPEGERINVLTEYLERLNRITDPVKREEERGKYVVIEIDGDSMEPRLEAGFKVLAYQIDSSAWDYQSSGIYGVEFGDQLVVKRVKDNTLLEQNILVLHSDNPEGGKLPVPRSEIRNLWKVERIIDGRL